jgi:hypothetical protein
VHHFQHILSPAHLVQPVVDDGDFHAPKPLLPLSGILSGLHNQVGQIITPIRTNRKPTCRERIDESLPLCYKVTGGALCSFRRLLCRFQERLDTKQSLWCAALWPH